MATIVDSSLYRPLQQGTSEFRLVILLPGAWHDEIRCSLKYADMDAEPDYEALSYTWGDASVTRKIYLDGAAFQVTENLEIALRYLRSDNPRVLWIDAICINQADLEERSAQVKRMQDIYAHAAKVVAWIGEADEHSEEACALMNTFEKLSDELPDKPFGIGSQVLGVDLTKLNWRSLWIFGERPYWTRIWVLQELFYSGILSDPTSKRCLIQCGHQQLSGGSFAATYMFYARLMMGDAHCDFEDPDSIVPEPWQSLSTRGTPALINMFRAMLGFTEFTGSAFRGPSIVDCMGMTNFLEASDSRDKLYAILGLSGKDARTIIPDYSKPSEQIYMELVRSNIERDENLKCISHNRSQCSVTLSWNPGTRLLADPWPTWQVGESIYKVSGDCKPQTSFDLAQKLLRVRGLGLDMISTVVGPLRTDPDRGHGELTHKGLRTSFNLQDFIDSVGSISESFEVTQKEALARLIVMDADTTDWENITTPAPSHMLEKGLITPICNPASFLDEATRLIPSDFQPELPFAKRHEYFLSDHFRAFVHAFTNRCFFMTSNGYMGIGPMDTKDGDIVALLYGGDFFFVLRPQDDKYALVGNAYVQGYMHGELLVETNRKCEEEIFTLC